MIKKKSSVNIDFNEKNGQEFFFGKDNLSFKTINMAKKQRYDNICPKFKLKKIINNKHLFLDIVKNIDI